MDMLFQSATTMQELSEQLARVLNNAQMPFDAKVYNIRDFHNVVERKYQEWLIAQKQQNQESQVKSEQENK